MSKILDILGDVIEAIDDAENYINSAQRRLDNLSRELDKSVLPQNQHLLLALEIALPVIQERFGYYSSEAKDVEDMISEIKNTKP